MSLDADLVKAQALALQLADCFKRIRSELNRRADDLPSSAAEAASSEDFDRAGFWCGKHGNPLFACPECAGLTVAELPVQVANFAAGNGAVDEGPLARKTVPSEASPASSGEPAPTQKQADPVGAGDSPPRDPTPAPAGEAPSTTTCTRGDRAAALLADDSTDEDW